MKEQSFRYVWHPFWHSVYAFGFSNKWRNLKSNIEKEIAQTRFRAQIRNSQYILGYVFTCKGRWGLCKMKPFPSIHIARCCEYISPSTAAVISGEPAITVQSNQKKILKPKIGIHQWGIWQNKLKDEDKINSRVKFCPFTSIIIAPGAFFLYLLHLT